MAEVQNVSLATRVYNYLFGANQAKSPAQYGPAGLVAASVPVNCGSGGMDDAAGSAETSATTAEKPQAPAPNAAQFGIRVDLKNGTASVSVQTSDSSIAAFARDPEPDGPGTDVDINGVAVVDTESLMSCTASLDCSPTYTYLAEGNEDVPTEKLLQQGDTEVLTCAGFVECSYTPNFEGDHDGAFVNLAYNGDKSGLVNDSDPNNILALTMTQSTESGAIQFGERPEDGVLPGGTQTHYVPHPTWPNAFIQEMNFDRAMNGPDPDGNNPNDQCDNPDEGCQLYSIPVAIDDVNVPVNPQTGVRGTPMVVVPAQDLVKGVPIRFGFPFGISPVGGDFGTFSGSFHLQPYINRPE